ncbi:WhiB family transcriptional regulator [Parasphingorhabdus pacifica]
MLTTGVPIADGAEAQRAGDAAGTLLDGGLEAGDEIPCRRDPDRWFAESPAELERAKSLCRECPIKTQCLTGALSRGEPWGVWGGEILAHGAVVERKRPRGRPRKHPLPEQAPAGKERAA